MSCNEDDGNNLGARPVRALQLVMRGWQEGMPCASDITHTVTLGGGWVVHRGTYKGATWDALGAYVSGHIPRLYACIARGYKTKEKSV